jgi:hypothetical protein
MHACLSIAGETISCIHEPIKDASLRLGWYFIRSSALTTGPSYQTYERTCKGRSTLLHIGHFECALDGVPHISQSRPVILCILRSQVEHQMTCAAPQPAHWGGKRRSRPASSQRNGTRSFWRVKVGFKIQPSPFTNQLKSICPIASRRSLAT